MFEELMKGLPMSSNAAGSKKTISVPLPEPLLAEAKALGINVSETAENGVVAAVAHCRRERWLRENAAAIQDYNEFVEKHGMVLDKYRLF